MINHPYEHPPSPSPGLFRLGLLEEWKERGADSMKFAISLLCNLGPLSRDWINQHNTAFPTTLGNSKNSGTITAEVLQHIPETFTYKSLRLLTHYSANDIYMWIMSQSFLHCGCPDLPFKHTCSTNIKKNSLVEASKAAMHKQWFLFFCGVVETWLIL